MIKPGRNALRLSFDTGVHPCFVLADAAHQAVSDGQLYLALALFQAAHDQWQNDQAPLDEDDLPELFWPERWTGAMLMLTALPARYYLDQPLSEPIDQTTLDSLMDRA